MSRLCATCVFHAGNRMRLRPGRLAAIVATNRERGTLLYCHTSTYGQAPAEVVCRGFYDRYGADSAPVQVLYRLGGHLRAVDPDE